LSVSKGMQCKTASQSTKNLSYISALINQPSNKNLFARSVFDESA